MSRRRASSVDQAGNNSNTTNGVSMQQHRVIMQQSISEDEEGDDYEVEVGNRGTIFVPDDSSSSHSSIEQRNHNHRLPSPPKSTMSLDGNRSYHGPSSIGRSSSDDLRYHSHDEADDFIAHHRTSSLTSEERLSVPSGAATIAAIPTSSNASQYCNTLVFTARRRKNPFLFTFIVSFTFLGVFWYTKSYATLHGALEQVTAMTRERNQVREYFFSVEEDIQRLQREMLELDQGVILMVGASGGDNHENGEGNAVNGQNKENVVDEMVALQEKLREGTSQVGSLQKHLQIVSRQDAIQKYGSGVIRVKLELEFPSEDKAKAGVGAPTVMVFEMAPLDLMPHSVYMFLEMVYNGLFDGCSFILNAMHVIKAAPLPYDGSSASQKVKAFTSRGLDSVAFREYSPDYPHEQYTVGFAADGSPSFYINTEDNVDEHVGEPCFAKVVSGFDTIMRMQAAPTRNGIFFRRRIGIKKATIL
jgi:hypothetical protein